MKRVIGFALLAIACVIITTTHARPIVIYNPSQSVPSGFYVRSGETPRRGQFVTVAAARVAPEYAALRGYADASDYFLKRVAATAGQLVCAEGEVISIDRVAIAPRMARDGEGHALPAWRGCRRLGADELFLLGDTDDSFDGRYWGPVAMDLIEGVWAPM
ncbi:MAG: S26 family signal peptidase [Alphaproteobacteria bacterium]|nr:MAG: S26 family signal peptidase [Alphaproteobacteria bacterium]